MNVSLRCMITGLFFGSLILFLLSKTRCAIVVGGGYHFLFCYLKSHSFAFLVLRWRIICLHNVYSYIEIECWKKKPLYHRVASHVYSSSTLFYFLFLSVSHWTLCALHDIDSRELNERKWLQNICHWIYLTLLRAKWNKYKRRQGRSMDVWKIQQFIKKVIFFESHSWNRKRWFQNDLKGLDRFITFMFKSLFEA